MLITNKLPFWLKIYGLHLERFESVNLGVWDVNCQYVGSWRAGKRYCKKEKEWKEKKECCRFIRADELLDSIC